MSRGFVKEDDQEEAPFIPPRASLPKDSPNYVTKRGLAQLQKEKEELIQERKDLNEENDRERRKALAVINGKLALLEERIQSVQLIKGEEQNQEEVRFGAQVRFLTLNGKLKGQERSFTIVGVDEANLSERRIAFTAPIVRSMMGKKRGEEFSFLMGGEKQLLKILSISYSDS